MEVYELSMPIVTKEIEAFNTNEDMFCTMDKNYKQFEGPCWYRIVQLLSISFHYNKR
jgi:hypothetical protein